MTTTALILVDIQNDYFSEGRWPVAEMHRVAENAARLLDQARRAGDRVIHIRHESSSDQASFFRPGTFGAQIHAAVAPATGESVLIKHKPNSFRDTNLQELLSGITKVVICGAMSQMCIDATARAAADLGYAVTVISDACGAKEQDFDGHHVTAAQVHAAIMAPLAMSYAQVMTTDVLIERRAEMA